VSVPLTGMYEWDITEKFLLGTHAHFGVHYLLSEKLAGVKVEPVKKFNTSYGAGLSLTYLFTDEISISLQPGFTAMVVFDPDTPIYWNFGAQIRISYAFGY